MPCTVWSRLVRFVPYFSPVLLAALRVAHPMSALESVTVSATGPFTMSSEAPACVCMEAELLPLALELVWDAELACSAFGAALLEFAGARLSSKPLLPAFTSALPLLLVPAEEPDCAPGVDAVCVEVLAG